MWQDFQDFSTQWVYYTSLYIYKRKCKINYVLKLCVKPKKLCVKIKIIHQNNKKNVNMSHRSWNKSTQIPKRPHELTCAVHHTTFIACLLANIFFPLSAPPSPCVLYKGSLFERQHFIMLLSSKGILSPYTIKYN